KAVLLPDGLFIFFCREALLRSTPQQIVDHGKRVRAPDASRSAGTGLATFFLPLRSTPLDTIARLRDADALVAAGSPSFPEN
ncbi:MAG TPA: hypothetical protein VLA83_16295, partial [Candidatus Binatia bacterium]|nr:hypothetical protein [Candidatus Binatia bacterium]